MTILSVILGILLIVGGFSCMFTPLATFLSTGYYFSILLLVYGIVGVVRFFKKQSGGLDLVISVLAVLAGLIAIFRPGQQLVFDRIMLYIIASWLFLQGLSTIVLSVKTRDEHKGWGWGVAAGIFGVIAGLYSFAHPLLTALTAGVLIGIYFVQSGFNMIVLGSALGAVKSKLKNGAEVEAKAESKQ